MTSKRFIGVEIEIGHACNQNCEYCPNSKFERVEKGEMELNLFQTLMEQLANIDYQGKISYHFYNEPLLSPNLEKYIELTSKYLPSARKEIYTNGVLLTKKVLYNLFELGIDKITVTQHLPDDEFTFIKLYRELPQDVQGKIKLLTKEKIHFTNRGGLMKEVGKQDIKLPLNKTCMIPSSIVVVTLKGNVLPCFEDYMQQNIMGNIGKESILDIWQSEKFEKFRNSLKDGERAKFPVCKECNSCQVIP